MAQAARGVANQLPGPMDPATPHDYTRVRLTLFDGGINTGREPEQLGPNELAHANQLFWYDGQLLVDSGYAPFGPPVPADNPHVSYQVFYPDGTAQLLLLTLNSLYVLSTSVPPQWQYVGYGGPSTLTAAPTATGSGTLVVTNGFTLFGGASLAIKLSNGLTWHATVTSGGGSTWTVTPVAPAPGVNASAGVSIIYPQPTLTEEVVQGDGIIAVTNTLGVSAGSRVGVILSDGSQWQFVADSVTTSLIYATASSPPCPSPGASIGAQVMYPLDLNGTLNVQPSIVSFPALGWVIISNGIDPILYYFQGVVAALPGLPDGTSCAAMNVFHECLFLGSMLENGTEFPQRIRMSDITDPTGWVPGQNGIAAIYNLVDTEDFILSLNLLGPWLIAYRETTIMRGTFLGLPNNTMFWEYMIFGEGAVSQGAVSEIGETHLVVGTQGIYEYGGGYDLISIGDNVFYQFLSAKGNLNASARSTLFTQYIGDQDEAWICYPSGSATQPNTMLRCSREKKAWYPRTFANQFNSAGFFLPLQTMTWLTATGTWAENTAAWNSRVFLLNAPTIILCDPTHSQTFIYDYNTPGDNGAALAWNMQTKIIGEGDSLQRWDTLALYGKGNGITLGYSLDPDTPPQTPVFVPMTDSDGNPLVINFGTSTSRQLVTFSAVSTYIQFQLSGTDPSFTLEYMELWYSFEGEY